MVVDFDEQSLPRTAIDLYIYIGYAQHLDVLYTILHVFINLNINVSETSVVSCSTCVIIVYEMYSAGKSKSII